MHCEIGGTHGPLGYIRELGAMRLLHWVILVALLCLRFHNARYIRLKSLTKPLPNPTQFTGPNTALTCITGLNELNFLSVDAWTMMINELNFLSMDAWTMVINELNFLSMDAWTMVINELNFLSMDAWTMVINELNFLSMDAWTMVMAI